MRLILTALIVPAVLVGCGDSKDSTSASPPPKAKEESSATVEGLLGNTPPPANPAPAAAPDRPPARPVPKPSPNELAAEAREYENWEQSTRKSDWEKMLQLYLSDHKGRFPDSIEELAKAFSRPLPPLPAGSFLYIDRTNKVVRLKRF